jgi:hypothetical protein
MEPARAAPLVQLVRVVDVLWLGPFLLTVAAKRSLAPDTRFLLAASGLATILFNGVRFLEEARD